MNWRRGGVLWIGVLILADLVRADNARIAVAANFIPTAKVLAGKMAEQGGPKIIVIAGSTGKLYAQIRNGAPFDAFLAADVKRPRLLEQDERIRPGSRRTYAIGRLALWSPRSDVVDPSGACLKKADFSHLALADPKLAPYGLAAQQVLQKMNLWSRLAPRLVRGRNIAQTFQFVHSGNAELGFVALSQLQQAGKVPEGSRWIVPQSSHEPVEQQCVLLTRHPAAAAFLTFLQSDRARAVIMRHGYSCPPMHACVANETAHVTR